MHLPHSNILLLLLYFCLKLKSKIIIFILATKERTRILHKQFRKVVILHFKIVFKKPSKMDLPKNQGPYHFANKSPVLISEKNLNFLIEHSDILSYDNCKSMIIFYFCNKFYNY